MPSTLQLVPADSETDPCCCEPDCCMYPADGLGSSYQSADLPSAVTINWPDHHEGSAEKDGSQYTAEGNEDVILKRNVDGTAWILEDSSDPENVVTLAVGNCLIRGDGNFTPGDDEVEDQFAGSYQVEATQTGYTGYYDQEIERESLCVWIGEGTEYQESSATLVYVSGGELEEIYPSALYKWLLVLGEGGTFAVKSGDQNTPVGSYEFGGVIGTATIS
jgi:hypothetical protein